MVVMKKSGSIFQWSSFDQMEQWVAHSQAFPNHRVFSAHHGATMLSTINLQDACRHV